MSRFSQQGFRFLVSGFWFSVSGFRFTSLTAQPGLDKPDQVGVGWGEVGSVGLSSKASLSSKAALF